MSHRRPELKKGARCFAAVSIVGWRDLLDKMTGLKSRTLLNLWAALLIAFALDGSSAFAQTAPSPMPSAITMPPGGAIYDPTVPPIPLTPKRPENVPLQQMRGAVFRYFILRGVNPDGPIGFVWFKPKGQSEPISIVAPLPLAIDGRSYQCAASDPMNLTLGGLEATCNPQPPPFVGKPVTVSIWRLPRTYGSVLILDEILLDQP